MNLYGELSKEYITKKELETMKQKYEKDYKKYKNIRYLFTKKRRFIKQYKNLEVEVSKRNENYLKKELNKCSSLFDNINGKSLDMQQRRAIVTEEDSLLVVAGAGSGKTLTIIGKIKYLLYRKEILPDKILCISFTNTITLELKETIKKSTGYDIDVVTFHKLGMQVLRQNKIYPKMIEEDGLRKMIENYFIQYLFQEEFKTFYSYYPLNQSFDVVQNYSNDKKLFFYKDIINLIITFLNLFKSKGYKKETWIQIEKKALEEKNRLIRNKHLFFLKIIKQIYFLYESYLEKENKIDFHDMIREATNILQNGGSFKKYDYIIVDEYQDTSFIRYELLKTLKEMGKSKVLAVGDDWQSIYRFTGCDIDMFTNFQKYFPYAKTLKIETTYRNPQELIDIAGNFIMKNKRQLEKRLKSYKSVKKPIKIYYYEKKDEFANLLNAILDDNLTFYILLRNHRDIDFLKNRENYIFHHHQITYLKYPNAKIYYYTVHSSKGLECDNVILINVEDSNLGFPNQILDDPILKYVSNKDTYLYEEERRLFYTALTRAKNMVYLFCNGKKPSLFVREMIKDNKKRIEILKKINCSYDIIKAGDKMLINGKEVEIESLLKEDYSKKMHKLKENGIYLSEEQIETLERYDIDYKKCTSIMQLINIIDEIMEEEEIPELDAIANELSEFKYYHLTNK